MTDALHYPFFAQTARRNFVPHAPTTVGRLLADDALPEAALERNAGQPHENVPVVRRDLLPAGLVFPLSLRDILAVDRLVEGPGELRGGRLDEAAAADLPGQEQVGGEERQLGAAVLAAVVGGLLDVLNHVPLRPLVVVEGEAVEPHDRVDRADDVRSHREVVAEVGERDIVGEAQLPALNGNLVLVADLRASGVVRDVHPTGFHAIRPIVVVPGEPRPFDQLQGPEVLLEHEKLLKLLLALAVGDVGLPDLGPAEDRLVPAAERRVAECHAAGDPDHAEKRVLVTGCTQLGAGQH